MAEGFIVAIPARFGASRLPGKPLRSLGGEPVIAHVVRRARAAGARASTSGAPPVNHSCVKKLGRDSLVTPHRAVPTFR